MGDSFQSIEDYTLNDDIVNNVFGIKNVLLCMVFFANPVAVEIRQFA
jgi:hypothetical protein